MSRGARPRVPPAYSIRTTRSRPMASLDPLPTSGRGERGSCVEDRVSQRRFADVRSPTPGPSRALGPAGCPPGPGAARGGRARASGPGSRAGGSPASAIVDGPSPTCRSRHVRGSAARAWPAPGRESRHRTRRCAPSAWSAPGRQGSRRNGARPLRRSGRGPIPRPRSRGRPWPPRPRGRCGLTSRSNSSRISPEASNLTAPISTIRSDSAERPVVSRSKRDE